MCFKSKVKTPKTDPDALKAPEPVLLEEPKGVDFGASEDDQSTDTGVDSVKVDLEDQGDGSSSATAADTGTSKASKPKASSSVKRAIKKVTK